MGESGSAGLAVTGGIRPFRFDVTAGAFPAGVVLQPTGEVSGVAAAAGTSSATVRVTDFLGRSSLQSVTLTAVVDSVVGTPPQLSNPRRLAGVVGFDISGTATAIYSVERSTDLFQWTTVLTTNAPAAQFPVVLPTTDAAAFFRVQGPAGGGYPLPIVAPIRVSPVLDSGVAVSADISPAGGTLSLTNSAGYVFTLTIPGAALEGPETITMTAVKSISDLPLSGGLRAAVSLDPEGLTFSQPVRLDITSPVGFPVKNTMGFGANQDGKEFALKHTFVTNHTATLYVWHFSLGGVGDGTAGDAQKQAANGPDNLADQYEQKGAAVLAACKADPSCNINDEKTLDGLSEIAIAQFDNVVKPALKQAVSDDSVLTPAIHGFLEWWHEVELLGLDRAGETDKVRLGRIQSRLAAGNSLASKAIYNALQKACKGCLQHDLNQIQKMMDLSRAAALLNYGDYLGEVMACVEKCLRFELHFRSAIELPTDLGIWTVKTESRVKLYLADQGVDITLFHGYVYLSGSARWDITDLQPPSLPFPASISSAPKSGRMSIPAFMLTLFKKRTSWIPGTGAVTTSIFQPDASMFLKATKSTPSENAKVSVLGIVQPLPDLFAPTFAAMHVNELLQQSDVAPPEWMPSFVLTGWAGSGAGDIILTRAYVQKLDEAVENTLIDLHHTPAQ